MDPSKILTAPPASSTSIEWIAVTMVGVVVVLVVVGVPFLLRFAREERREALQAFRDEIAAERSNHATLVAETHQRIDAVREKVEELREDVLRRGAAA